MRVFFWICTIGIMLVFGMIMDKIETKMYSDLLSWEIWLDTKSGKPFRAAFAFLREFAKGIGSMRGWSFLRIPVCLYLTTSIAMHMTYSSVDLNNGMTGLYVTLIVYLIIGLISALFFRKKYLDFALDIGVLLFMLFTFGALTKLMVWGILRLIVHAW